MGINLQGFDEVCKHTKRKKTSFSPSLTPLRFFPLMFDPKKSLLMRLSFILSLLQEDNLIPRVSHLTAPWASEEGALAPGGGAGGDKTRDPGKEVGRKIADEALSFIQINEVSNIVSESSR